MNQHSSEEETYEVLSADQWKVRWSDVRAAFGKPTLKEKADTLMLVYQHTRIGRALYRYQYQRGKLAAGGISFMAIFSLVAALTVGWTIFAHFFIENPRFQSTIVDAIDNMLPGILDNPETGVEGLIDPDSIVIGPENFITGLVAFVIAVYSASRIVRYIGDGIRSMFGLLQYPKNFLLLYPRYLLGLVLLLLTVVATALLSIASAWLDQWLTGALDLSRPLRDYLTFDVFSFLIPFAVNLLTFAAMVRYVADVRVPRKSLWIGATAFAVVSAVLQIAGSLILSSSSNPLIVAAATVGTLLLWINILARTAMMICAWMANPPAVVAKVTPDEVRANRTPNYVTVSDPESLSWPYHPISGDLIPAIPEDEYQARLHGRPADGALEAKKIDYSPEQDEGEATADSKKSRKGRADGPPPTGEELGPKTTEWVSEK